MKNISDLPTEDQEAYCSWLDQQELRPTSAELDEMERLANHKRKGAWEL